MSIVDTVDAFLPSAAHVIEKLLRNRTSRTVLTGALLVIVVSFLLYSLAPFLIRPNVGHLLAADQSARLILQQGREAGLHYVSIPVTPLAAVYAHVPIYRGDYPVIESVDFRWDSIVVLVGSIFVIVLLSRELVASVFRTRRFAAGSPASSEIVVELPSPKGNAHRVREDGDGVAAPRGEPAAETRTELHNRESFASQRTATAESVLSDDVARAVELAIGLYSRSTLLLVGGIAMAFVGIGVFWASLPAVSKVPGNLHDVALAYLPLAVRPVAMLVFVEAIAWFLLRQYRQLIEDYKTFHRVYLRRVNFLAAFKISSSKEATAAELAIAAALLSDDVTGRLKKGETTEHLEAIRQIEPNPVAEMFLAVISSATSLAGKASLKRRVQTPSREE